MSNTCAGAAGRLFDLQLLNSARTSGETLQKNGGKARSRQGESEKKKKLRATAQSPNSCRFLLLYHKPLRLLISVTMFKGFQDIFFKFLIAFLVMRPKDLFRHHFKVLNYKDVSLFRVNIL